MLGGTRRLHWQLTATVAAAVTACLGVEVLAQQPPLPTFAVDASWPRIPDKYKLGDVSSIAIDAQDNAYVLHRPRTLKPEETASAAPPVVVFDPAGNFIKAWGGEGVGYEWIEREHGIHIDHKGFAWIGGNQCPTSGTRGLKAVADDQLLKFTLDGKFVLQIGKSNQSKGDADTANVHRAADAWVLPRTNEVFVADGYGNHRVIVFDAETGAYRRHWGAYGNVPDDDVDLGPYDPGAPSQQFRGPVHGIDLSRDGLLYVADRSGNRIQVFRRNGDFVQEGFVAPETRDLGTAYGVAVSPDQRWIYVNDGSNNKIWILRRDDLETVGSLSSYGRNGGQIMSGHSMAVDARGNIYVGETRGRRVQRWILSGGA